MVKECSKKCSNCGHNGHNTRSCAVKKNKEICVKLFGFKIHVPEKQQHEYNNNNNDNNNNSTSSSSISNSSLMMRKSKSTPNLNACHDKDDDDHDIVDDDHNVVDEGYLSDHIPRPGDKKKGVPWTEFEHLSFLSGLEKLGKGDWKGISRNYVHSRTATQVASHAQKYFKRLNLTDKRNRRFSLFDMALKEPEIKSNPPPEPPDTTNEETPRLADNLLAFNVNLNSDAEEQESTFAKADATPLTAPPVFPYPYRLPDFSQMPYIPMMGLPNHGQLFSGEKSLAAMPAVMPPFQMMYIPNPGYFYSPNFPGSQFSSTFFMPTFNDGSSSPMARP